MAEKQVTPTPTATEAKAMDKKKIVKYVVIAVFIAVVVYFAWKSFGK